VKEHRGLKCIYRGCFRNGRDITSLRWVRMLLVGEEITVWGRVIFSTS
jgi:hypothetical protein